MAAYTDIACDADPELIVHIDRDEPAAAVRFSYERNAIEHSPTPFQTVDMPWDDQAAAAKVNDWLDSL